MFQIDQEAAIKNTYQPSMNHLATCKFSIRPGTAKGWSGPRNQNSWSGAPQVAVEISDKDAMRNDLQNGVRTKKALENVQKQPCKHDIPSLFNYDPMIPFSPSLAALMEARRAECNTPRNTSCDCPDNFASKKPKPRATQLSKSNAGNLDFVNNFSVEL